MSVYPSLEDLKVDEMAKTQVAAGVAQAAIQGSIGPDDGSLYSNLGLDELMSYGGLDISEGALVQYVPQDVMKAIRENKPIVALTASDNKGVQRAEVKQGVRQVILAKDGNGKIGLAVQAISKGIFAAFVWTNSASSAVGIRFGDQILEINGKSVAGWTQKQAIKFIKEAAPEKMTMIVRDRPFDRTVTLIKDSSNHVGFVFKKGEITAIVKDSSAARNGLLIHHHLVEVNGQTVVGLHDKDVLQIIKESPPSVTVTIMPNFVFDHLVKNIGFETVKKHADHQIPDN